MTLRGRFIVLEGLDRSGKSTQVQALVNKLSEGEGRAVSQKFPGTYGTSIVADTRPHHAHRYND